MNHIKVSNYITISDLLKYTLFLKSYVEIFSIIVFIQGCTYEISSILF